MQETPILSILEKVRRRPAIYIGHQSLHDLALFITGASFVLSQYGLRDKVWEGFQDWTAKRFGLSVAQSWYNIIWFVTGSDSSALEAFWRLLDEYLEEQRSPTQKANCE
jgi:hypothetical protein